MPWLCGTKVLYVRTQRSLPAGFEETGGHASLTSLRQMMGMETDCANATRMPGNCDQLADGNRMAFIVTGDFVEVGKAASRRFAFHDCPVIGIGIARRQHALA